MTRKENLNVGVGAVASFAEWLCAAEGGHVLNDAVMAAFVAEWTRGLGISQKEVLGIDKLRALNWLEPTQ